MKCLRVAVATYDVTFMLGTACEYCSTPFLERGVYIMFVIDDIQTDIEILGTPSLQTDAGFTHSHVMIVYKNVFNIRIF